MAGLEAAFEEDQNDWIVGGKEVRDSTGSALDNWSQGTRDPGFEFTLVCLWGI